LQPWHFTVIAEEGLQRFSDLLVQSTDSDSPNLERIAKKPFRAPMIIVVSTEFVQHEKVPTQEQLISVGCCAHAMQMASVAMGYGAMWRTGGLAYNAKIKQGLSIKENDEIVGFLYIGTPCKEQTLKSSKCFEDKVSYWK
jgi:nitroreductase